MKKVIKKRRIGLEKVLLIPILFIVGYLAVMVLDAGYPLCFSQEYRKIEGVENIIFQRGNDKYYKRFWGD